MSNDGPTSLAEMYDSTPDKRYDRRMALAVAGLVVLSLITGALLMDSLGDSPEAEYNSPLIDSNSNYNTLYEDTANSIVSISTETNSTTPGQQGTGFVYEDEYIVTNHHVVSDAETIYIQYAEGEWARAELVGTDYYTDLAVLEPNSRPDYAEPLEVREQYPRHGEPVVVIGNPVGLRGSITSGIVSGTERTMQTGSGFSIPDMIQTDSPLNPGNSGGPLLSEDGEVIGVVNAKQGENIGFAISARTMSPVTQSLIDDGNHTHPYLGVASIPVTPRVSEEAGLPEATGVMVVQTMDNNESVEKLQPATEYTTRSESEVPLNGDVIIAIDGHRLDETEDLSSYLVREKQPGESVDLTVFRDGKTITVTITLEERPDPEQPIDPNR